MVTHLFFPVIQSTTADILQTAYRELGYGAYDPFAGGSGTPIGYKTFIRHFCAPTVNTSSSPVNPVNYTWTVIFGDPDPAVYSHIRHDFLLATLTESSATLTAYHVDHNAPTPLFSMQSTGTTDTPETGGTSSEIAALAEQNGVNPKQFQSMFERMAGSVFRQIENKQTENRRIENRRIEKQADRPLDKKTDARGSLSSTQARNSAAELIKGEPVIDWRWDHARAMLNQLAGQGITPTFTRFTFNQIRDGYQAARRVERSPKALLMPDEQAALTALPDALQWSPLYVGREN